MYREGWQPSERWHWRTHRRLGLKSAPAVADRVSIRMRAETWLWLPLSPHPPVYIANHHRGDAMKTIRQLRQERGWSQLALALDAGVTQSIISRWERGELVPQPRNLHRLAQLFGVSTTDIALKPAEQAPQDRP